MQNAMVDLTGGISEIIDLSKKDEVSPELFSLLVKSYNMKTLMGAAIFVSIMFAIKNRLLLVLKLTLLYLLFLGA